MAKVTVSDVKEVKTLEVAVKTDNGTTGFTSTVSFRFKEENATDAEVSLDGGPWQNVGILHKAIGAFFDRHPPEFSE